jgi:acyl-CoA synthetase (AMP-forming)/AMP-acid ligase II
VNGHRDRSDNSLRDRWKLRAVSEELTAHYVSEGWWDSRSLGEMIHESLTAADQLDFNIHSALHPWRGSVGEVAHAARSFATGLRARGIGPGSIVVMQLPNWAEAAITFWGAAYAGAVVVPVVHFYGAKEVAHILRVTRPSLLITPDRFGRIDYRDSLSGVVDELGVPWAVVNASGSTLPTRAVAFSALLDADPLNRPVSVDPDEPAIVAFTSGTTRAPKGVVHSHRSIGFEARQSAEISPKDGPPSIVGAPVGHFMGMLSALLGSLVRAVPINLLDVWNPTEVLRLMLQEGLGLSGGAPYFFTSLLEHADFTAAHLRHMPHAGLGGAPVPLTFTRRLADLGIDVMRSYGSTEHPTITGCTFDEPADKRMTTDGHSLPGVEVRVDDDGQIFSRGPDLFLGYTDADLTAGAFDDDGWYRTGDVGALDSEGFLTITDRISDVIIRGGENISAQEVEELLLQIPGVAEVAVVAEPDDRFGERAVAVVRPPADTPPPDLDHIRTRLASAGLAKQKWPESVRTVADFPRTPSGKVQKFKLRAQLRDGVLEHEVRPGH